VERESLVPFDPLYPDYAAKAVAVFKSLRMVDVPGKPTFGEACEPFVFDFVGAIFGAYDEREGVRHITEFMLLISKKNGKSTIAAGIMVTALILNWRDLAELIILAPTIEVAGNSFKPAAAMVRADPDLERKFHIINNTRTIRHRQTQAELRVVAADTGTVGGAKAGFILIDELWLFGKRADAEDLFEEATGGMASRPEGFVVYLTTHSNEPPAGIYKEKLEYFRDVRDGNIADPTCFGMLYEWPEQMIEDQAYLKAENFYLTNPNLGRSVSTDFIAGKLRKASRGELDEGEEDASLQVVLAKYLNVEIGVRLRRDRWRGADFWDQRGDTTLTLEALLDRCEVVVAGADGGGLDDLYGLCIAGRERESKRWLFWFKAWVWPEVLKLRKQIAPRLKDFSNDGDLVICEPLAAAELDPLDENWESADTPQDIAEIVEILVQVRDSGLMPDKAAIGLDPHGVADLVDALADAEFADEQIVAIGQGYRLMSAVVGLARKLKFAQAAHNGAPMMAWCVGNAKEEQGRQTVMLVKNGTATAKIDPLMAAMNATKLLEMNPEAAGPGRSVYEDREAIVI